MRTMSRLFLFCFALAAPSQIIEIPDPAFREYLINGTWIERWMDFTFIHPYDSDGDGEISVAEAEAVTGQMVCLGLGIEDMTGLEHFTNINMLFCGGNRIAHLPDLSGFSSLAWLSCPDNLLETITLPPSLTRLECSGNNLSMLPSLPEELFELRCAGNRLESLPDLTALPYLQILDCANNQLTELSGFSADLRELDCSRNRLATLGTLPGSLRTLRAAHNALDRFPDLTSLRALQEAELQGNSFTASDCAAIEALMARGTRLVFNPQADGSTLTCSGGRQLVAVIPWIVDDSQWSSRISLFNEEPEPVMVSLMAHGSKGTVLEKQIEVVARSVFAAASGDLFPEHSEYALSIWSPSGNVHATAMTFNRKAGTYRSPSQASAVPSSDFSATLLFPYLAGDQIPALVLFAPLETESVTVTLELFDEAGGIAARTEVTLQGKIPYAALVADLFGQDRLPRDISVIARAPERVRLAGTSFVFNDLLDPAMARGIPID